MQLAILGFGLIGGSIARALHDRTPRDAWRVAAWSRRVETVQRALADGVVHLAAATVDEAVKDADLVLLAAPPLTCIELLRPLAETRGRVLATEATITDVASAKGRIVARADALKLPFVGGHPMAGREVTGYGAASGDLFEGRPWVTVAGRCARLVDGERVSELIDACGAVQVPMAAREHDEAVAAISHLPLVVSAALVETVVGRQGEPARSDWRTADALAATGWAGMTRLARGDAAMGAGIAATNAEALGRRLRDLRDVLDSWIAELERNGGPDAARLQARFEAARRRLTEEAR